MKRLHFILLAIAVGVGGCASGGVSEPAQRLDGPPGHDAPNHPIDAPLHDAPPGIDAKVFLDAPPQIDAPAGGFCVDNTQCPSAGTCCLIAICVPGTAIGTSLCFPN